MFSVSLICCLTKPLPAGALCWGMGVRKPLRISHCHYEIERQTAKERRLPKYRLPLCPDLMSNHRRREVMPFIRSVPVVWGLNAFMFH